MKKLRAILVPVVLCLLLSGCSSQPFVPLPTEEPRVTEAPRETPDPLQTDQRAIAEHMVQVYGSGQPDASEQISRDVMQLTSLNPERGALWADIMDYWQYCDSMIINMDTLPDDLPDDDTFCLVVLGYQLNPDGTMRDELIGRLWVTLQCAQQYPNAYVLCTGGGTAFGNPYVTEGGQMAQWLMENGLNPERILIEDRSYSTAENAVFSYELLRSEAPHVQYLAIITSSYHVRWGALLFGAQLKLHQAELEGKKMQVLSNAAYDCSNAAYPETRSNMLLSMRELIDHADWS